MRHRRDSGFVLVLSMMSNPGLYLQYMASGGGTYTFPHDPGVFGENTSTYDAFGKGVNLVPAFNVVLSRAIDMSPSVLAGFMIGSVGGTTARFRMKRVDVTATATVSAPAGSGAEHRTSTAQVRAQVMIGPL